MLEFLGSTASLSPVPLPGILPPTLKGRSVEAHVFPRSLDLMMAPGLGSHELVYMPWRFTWLDRTQSSREGGYKRAYRSSIYQVGILRVESEGVNSPMSPSLIRCQAVGDGSPRVVGV